MYIVYLPKHKTKNDSYHKQVILGFSTQLSDFTVVRACQLLQLSSSDSLAPVGETAAHIGRTFPLETDKLKLAP